MPYLTYAPWWLQKIYPQCIWQMPTAEKVVYLTFDDGPHPEATPFVLEQLKQFGAKACFFCIGKNVAAHPEIFKAVLADGHRVGNHTMYHANGWKTENDVYAAEVTKAASLIDSNLFRPPYGRIKKAQIKALTSEPQPYKIIMWSILSGDFDTAIDGEKCFQNIIRRIKPGSIIVFHDSAKALPRLQYALPKLLQWVVENGYRSENL